jgi:hypothetical protein
MIAAVDEVQAITPTAAVAPIAPILLSVPVRPERTFPAAGMQFGNLSIPVVLP